MSEQVHKTLLACDGLNRTGQEAPASRGKSRKQSESLQLAVCNIGEGGRDGLDNDIHMEEQPRDIVDDEKALLEQRAFQLLTALSLKEVERFTRLVIIAQLQGALPPFEADLD